MDKTDRLRDYGLAFLLYEQGLGLCGYELIRELFIFVKLILNSYLDFGTGNNKVSISMSLEISNETSSKIIINISSTNQQCHKYNDVISLIKDVFRTEAEPQNGEWNFELGDL